MRVARRAGIHIASAAAITRAMGMPTNVAASVAEKPQLLSGPAQSARASLDFGYSQALLIGEDWEPVMPKKKIVKSKKSQQVLSGIGATEQQVDMKDTVPQRIDQKGTKVEDLAGTGEQDSPGG